MTTTRSRSGATAIVVVGILLLVLSHRPTAQGGWQANDEVVRRTSQQQPKFNYDEARVGSYTLPDPLATAGSIVRTAAEWPRRRAEILTLFREHVYGRSPGPPERLRFDVIEQDAAAMDGAATLKRVAVV